MVFHQKKWELRLLVSTISITAFLLALLAWFLYFTITHVESVLIGSLIMLPVSLVLLVPIVLSYRYAPNGINVTPTAVIVKKRNGFYAIPLNEVVEVVRHSVSPKGMLRTMGNGGLFGIYGDFRNDEIGRFRMSVTNMNSTVLIVTRTRKYIVSCDEPDELCSAIQRNLQTRPPHTDTAAML